METSQDISTGYPRALSKVLHNTYAATQSRVSDIVGFTDFCRSVKKLPNFTGDANIDFPRASQKLFGNYNEDLWNLWNAFGDNAENIARVLFERKMVNPAIKREGLSVALNYNSYSFYRDTNISLSLVNTHTNQEMAVVGFFILPNKQVEIFQIQGRQKYGIGVAEFGYLLQEVKSFLANLGFEKVLIVKADRLFLTHKPTNLPKHITNHQEMETWLTKHKEHMKLTYDVNPVRKWGFKKSHDRDYSSYTDL